MSECDLNIDTVEMHDEYNKNRFDITNDKYIGLSFYHYFHFVIQLNHYYIHSCNNTYIGHDLNNKNNVEGNEKYEVICNFIY